MTKRGLVLAAVCWWGAVPLTPVTRGAPADPAKPPAAAAEGAAPETKPPKTADPPNAEPAKTNPRVEALLDDLESLDAAAREAATKELVRLGPSVLPALEERLADLPGPELTARAKMVKDGVARAWRYWVPDGGRIAGGFQATLAPADEVFTFAAGAPVLFNVEVRNVSPEPRQFTDVRGVDFDLGDGPNAVFSSPFCDARVVIRRTDGGPMPPAGRALVYDTGEPRPIRFKTGGNVLTPVRLDGGVTLPPGEYEVRFVYYARTKGLLKDALDDLQSNPVKFKVTEAAEEKK